MRNVNTMSYKKLFNLQGKNAIVTGGLGILGQHFCEGLAESGANIAVVDLNSNKVQEFALLLQEKYRVNAIGYACDVSDIKSVHSMVGDVSNKFGEINIRYKNLEQLDDLCRHLTKF